MRFVEMAAVVGAACIISISLGGCAVIAVAAGAGAGISYINGASVTTLEGSPEQIAVAAEQAFWQMQMVVVSSTSRASQAHVIGRTACDDKVEVCIEARSCNVADVSVRAGVFGDQYLQNRVLSAISENLTASAPEAIAPEPPLPELSPEQPASEPTPPETGSEGEPMIEPQHEDGR